MWCKEVRMNLFARLTNVFNRKLFIAYPNGSNGTEVYSRKVGQCFGAGSIRENSCELW